MSMKFGTGGASGSTLGKQFNDKFWSRAAVLEAKKKKVFSQLGDKLTQPKNYGDTIVKYHELPILHASNINDQGIDAAGVSMVAGKWYAYTADGTRTEHDTKADAKASTDMVRIQSGDGNLYGGSKDISVIKGAFPSLTEEGGKVNQVGMKRLDLEAKVTEFGFHMSFTKKSLEMDTEKGLLARYSRNVGEAQGDLREQQIQMDLLSASENNRVYAGGATAMAEVGSDDILTFADLRQMDKYLKDARCPKDTKLISGSTKVGTSTVSKARYVYVGSEMVPTLEDMQHNSKDLWVPVEMYADAGTIADGEIGKIGQFRFIEVEDMGIYEGEGASISDATDDDDVANRYTTGDNYDVFPVLFVGSGSFATVGFEGDVAKVQTAMPKMDAHNDVYGKKGAVSIAWYYGMMFLRPEWLTQVAGSAKIA